MNSGLKMQKLLNGTWINCAVEDLTVGDTYRISVGGGGWQQQVHNPESNESIERQWRDSELLRTDEIVKLPDYPVDLLSYRTELRNYPAQPDFPNGTRPTL